MRSEGGRVNKISGLAGFEELEEMEVDEITGCLAAINQCMVLALTKHKGKRITAGSKGYFEKAHATVAFSFSYKSPNLMHS